METITKPAAVTVRELDAVAFQTYGQFMNLINPTCFGFGKPPVQFFRDAIQGDLGGIDTISYSVCRVEPRPFVITGGEFHNKCCEGILPMDNDVLIHVAPGTNPRIGVPTDLFEVFRVPKGTMVVLRPGVWHGAPWTVNDQPANVLIVLPERTYANDCVNARLEENQQIEIKGV